MTSTLPHYPLFIDGEWCEGAANGTLTSVNPATEKPWASAAVAEEDDVNRAVASAKRALFDGPWAAMTATRLFPSKNGCIVSNCAWARPQ